MMKKLVSAPILALTLAAGFGAVAPAAHASYAGMVLANNPAAYYRFEETSGTTALNSAASGAAFNGTYQNGVAQGQPGIFGFAAGFDGLNDFVSAPQPITNRNMTLEAWVNTTQTAPGGSGQGFSGDGVIWSDVGGPANDFILAQVGNHIGFFTGTPEDTISSGAINDGRWHYVVATRSVTAGIATKSLYIDGALAATTTYADNDILNDNGGIAIGANTLDGRYYQGLIDEAALYNSALTAADVAAHYGAAVPEPVSGALLALGLLGLGWSRRARR